MRKTGYIAQVKCDKCAAFFESFEVTKEGGLKNIKCTKCGRKALHELKFKRRLK